MKNINLATKITLFRVVLIPLLLIVLLLPVGKNVYFNIGPLQCYLPYFIGLIIFVIASCSDAVDGYIARSSNTVTNLGKFLDPVADKLLVNSILIFFASTNHLPVLAVMIMILRDIAVDALRFIAAENNVVIAASIYGKFKTIFQMVSLSLVLLCALPQTNLYIWLLVLIWITTLISLVSGIDYFIKNKKVLS
ncbi:MAG: CDP-diacylglycerol--glycerol-3-phosphate 3-phosphatidyltransferase [Bacilli bacterium]|jgi:CDP-diacylglycerol--glycerol-3-phosphate 3-phosphatidyltransferase|nr:CDP-diacylglycerol--glycerol-3-phosphate 3-phosphatidyltransferase [Bacilli bacterium]